MPATNETERLEPAGFTLRLPGPLLDAATRAAREQGQAEGRYVSTTAWINEAIREKLARKENGHAA